MARGDANKRYVRKWSLGRGIVTFQGAHYATDGQHIGRKVLVFQDTVTGGMAAEFADAPGQTIELEPIGEAHE